MSDDQPWLCLGCGSETRRGRACPCGADLRDRAPADAIQPREWHTWLEFRQPRRRECKCGGTWEQHAAHDETALRLRPDQRAGFAARGCKVFFCAAALRGAKCEGNPCTCTVQVKQLSKARTKLALNRYRPPKPREMFRDLVNADGDVVFDVAAEEDEASTGWPYDTIARRATEENDDET